MQANLQTLLEETRQIEESLVAQLKDKEGSLHFSINDGAVAFDNEVMAKHCEMRTSVHRFLYESSFLAYLVCPVIYGMLIPAVIVDVFAWFYQLICFPVYGIPKVVRSDYIAFDRSSLGYLNLIERVNCDYCAYFNGVIAYMREIASRTEQYFCPIRHALRVKGLHARHAEFLSYGDATDYHTRLEELREQLRKIGLHEPLP